MVKPRYIIYNDEAIAGIKVAARMAATAKNRIAKAVCVGMTTMQIDQLAGDIIRYLGGVPTFFGYYGYPGQICISVNDEVAHGIGSHTKVIVNGDLVSIDVGVTYGGYIGDNALSFIVGEPADREDVELLRATGQALMAGLMAARAGNFVKDIGVAVEKIANSAKLAVVRDYVGHGCGIELHEPPEVPNFATSETGPLLRPGMVLCIEPMFNLGSNKVYTESDDWTVRTRDGKKSAHFEHMVLVTKTDPEILTWQKT